LMAMHKLSANSRLIPSLNAELSSSSHVHWNIGGVVIGREIKDCKILFEQVWTDLQIYNCEISHY